MQTGTDPSDVFKHRLPRLTVCVTYEFHNMVKYREHISGNLLENEGKAKQTIFFNHVMKSVPDTNSEPRLLVVQEASFACGHTYFRSSLLSGWTEAMTGNTSIGID